MAAGNGGIREAYLVCPDESGGRVLEKNSPLAEQLSDLYGLDRYFIGDYTEGRHWRGFKPVTAELGPGTSSLDPQ
ncbi:hypothetical protein JXA88_12610 [Candidatus Fermentibacteria bacterium]|nr:hypothetical protein [Candidatus Fermentibacteria bacterium]